MSDSSGGLVLEVKGKVNHTTFLRHVVGSNISDPSGDGSREEANLQFFTLSLSNGAQNL